MNKTKCKSKFVLAIILISFIMQFSVSLLVSSQGLMPNISPASIRIENEMNKLVESGESKIAQNDMRTGKDAFNSYSASNDATLLSSSISGTGTIDYLTDQYDNYKFHISFNTYTTLEFRPPPGVKGLDLIIYNPDKSIMIEMNDVNTTIKEHIDSRHGYMFITVDADVEEDKGIYFLELSNNKVYNDMNTGQEASDSYLPSDGSTYLFKKPIKDYGEIDASTDENDQYRISVHSEDVVTIIFTPPYGSEGVDLLIFDYDKSLLNRSVNVIKKIKVIVTASGDGCIYITINADVPKDKGMYYLDICTSADHDVNTGEEAWNSYTASINATRIFSGDKGFGSICYPKDQYDQYKIAVDSGDEVEIYFSPPEDSTTIDLRIIDTDMKTELKLISNIVYSKRYTVKATQVGFIYFIIDADSLKDIGFYYIRVISTAGNDMKSGGDADDNYWASDSATLLKTPITATGKLIGSLDQYDQYKIAVESGDEITIFLNPPSGAELLDLLIYDSDKKKIKEVSNINSPITTKVIASGNGFIYFVVDADNSSDYGEYTLSICSSGENDMGNGEDAYDSYYPSTNADLYAYGSGYISYKVDKNDQYKIPVIRGRELRIYFRPPKDSKGVDLIIYGPDMKMQKRYNDVRSEISSTERVAEDGYIYIIVCASDPADTGGYGLVVFTSNPVTKYAVIVGISDYKALSDLKYCDEDAADWYHHLNPYIPRFDEIQVYGDTHTSHYPQYNGLATEYNVKKALRHIVAQADENDVIAFISSGHGSGNGIGSSYLCQWDCKSGENGEDGNFYDYELANILDDSVADRIFVFLDHCLSGGFGPNLMGMPNSQNVYCTTTCTESGYGYDGYNGHKNAAWIYFFLEYSWQSHYGTYNTAMEDVFDYAHAAYPYTGIDEAQEFDGDPAQDFFL